jgi:tetratricopeptide (TPR) repeat protein
MIRFEHIEFLWALAGIPLLVLLYFFVLWWKRKTAKKIGDPELVKELIKNYSPQKFALKFLLILTAFAVCAFAAGGLKKPQGNQQITRNGIDVVLAIDVSKSMLAQDIKPNRLERAKLLLGKLIDRLGNHRVGLVVFAGRAYIQMPLTADQNAARLYLSSVNTDMVPTQGTVIGDALKMSYAAFAAKEKKYKAVVLISDGEDHDESAGKIAEAMAADGVVINTVGIGSPEGSTIIDEATNEVKKDVDGHTVISKLNEKELKDIAAKGNGIYQLFSNSGDVAANLEAQLNSMGSRTISETSGSSYTHYFTWFLAAALFLLVIEMIVSEKRRSKKSTTVQLVLFALVIFLPLSGIAQQENKLIKKGNDAYNKKEYSEAAKQYRQVTDKSPANTTAQHNLGNALYKSNKSSDAVEAYDKALEAATTPEDKARIYYNKAVVLQNQKKLPECVEAYKAALTINPADEDARLNLQKALQQVKQKQQQEKQPKKPKEDPKKKEKEKKKDEEKNNNELPKPQPSRLTKQEAEEKLKALMQQEKNLQEKLRKVNAASVTKPEKDW